MKGRGRERKRKSNNCTDKNCMYVVVSCQKFDEEKELQNREREREERPLENENSKV